MPIPKFDQTFLPILKVLSNGETVHRTQIPDLLVRKGYVRLTDEELTTKTNTGHILFHNRVGWGLTYLKQGKYIHQPSRGFVVITDKGKALLKSGTQQFLLADLKRDEDYRNYEPKTKTESPMNVVEELTPQEIIDKGFEELNTSLKKDLLEKLHSIDPYYFERVVLILFHKMGYGEFTETSKSGDGGIDGIINQDQLGLERIYVQAKRYGEGTKVREPDIRNFIGAMSSDVAKGIFVTTSSFDQSAIKKAHDARNLTIILIDGSKLAELMVKFNVGVQTKTTYEVKEVDEDFFELE